jgi:hypothetical protein
MPDWREDVRTRLAPLRLSPAREAEIVDELAQHLEDRYRDQLNRGASPEEAARAARSEFGDGNRLAERMRPLRRARAPAPLTLRAATGHLLADLWHDATPCARRFAR